MPKVEKRRADRQAQSKSEKAGTIRYREIAFVAYPVTDMARAREFYEGVLNLKPNAPVKSENPQWIEYDIGPGTLGIGSSPQWLPSQDGASAALEVQDFEAALSKIAGAGAIIPAGGLRRATNETGNGYIDKAS